MSDGYTGGRVDVPVEGTHRSFKGQVTPMTAEQAIRTFGGDIDLKQPHLLLCDPGDGQGIKDGDRVIFNSERYFVAAPVMNWGAGLSTDCCQILIEKEQFQ